MARSKPSFDPLAILATLERNYVDYVLIGGLAQVLRGADVVTAGVDICPSFARENSGRLGLAGEELDARLADGHPPTFDDQALSIASVMGLSTSAGELNIVGSPVGVPNGYVDLRRAATREDLGHGLRPLVASTGDLAAMAAARQGEVDPERLRMLRRIVELEARRQQAAQRATDSPRSTQRRSARPGRRISR